MKLHAIETIILGTVSSLLATFLFYNYLPLSVIDFVHQTPQKFGTTITTINGTDTISGSRTTINTNFSNLNTAKIEVSDLAATTSLKQLTTLANLATVGTITTGIWNGTPITTSFGGTGSTTLSQYQVLLGNGTGNVTVPVGWGTAQQILTSNGPGAAPSWQSGGVDTSLNYRWTGNHDFVGSTLIKTLTASTTLTFSNAGAGYSITLPSTQGASSTAWLNNGSGTLYSVNVATTTATPTIVTNTFSAPTTIGSTANGSATCGANQLVSGGGFSGIPNPATNLGFATIVTDNYASSQTSWQVNVKCAGSGSCTSGTITVYAICVNP